MRYPLIFNFDKKKDLHINYRYNFNSIESAYSSSLKFVNSIYLFVLKKKKVNSMNIYLSSFFYKNYINFNVIKEL